MLSFEMDYNDPRMKTFSERWTRWIEYIRKYKVDYTSEEMDNLIKDCWNGKEPPSD